jgi:hypothetical protein
MSWNTLNGVNESARCIDNSKQKKEKAGMIQRNEVCRVYSGESAGEEGKGPTLQSGIVACEVST